MWSRRRQKYLYRSWLGLGETHFLHCFVLVQRVQPHVRRTAAKMISVMLFFVSSLLSVSRLLPLSFVFHSSDHFSCECRDPTLFKNNLYPNGRLQQTMLIRCSFQTHSEKCSEKNRTIIAFIEYNFFQNETKARKMRWRTTKQVHSVTVGSVGAKTHWSYRSSFIWMFGVWCVWGFGTKSNMNKSISAFVFWFEQTNAFESSIKVICGLGCEWVLTLARPLTIQGECGTLVLIPK